MIAAVKIWKDTNNIIREYLYSYWVANILDVHQCFGYLHMQMHCVKGKWCLVLSKLCVLFKSMFFFTFIICENVSVPFEELIQHSYTLLFCSLLMSFCGWLEICFANPQISVIGIYVFLYGQLYLVLSGLEKALLIEAKVRNIQSLETALASQSFIQLGLLTGLPMVMEIGLEKGFLTAIKDFILMQLQLASVFFTFSLGTKAHYYGRTILHGGAKYRPTGRKVVVFHTSFTENYRLYSRSHFVKGFEILLLLIVYDLFRRSYESSMAYVLITYSIWFMSITWLFAPFLFNPSGFSWDKIVDDWKDWNKWIRQQGGIGVQQDKSWQSWWDDEQSHLRRSGLGSRLIEILLSFRFFIYQYGLVYHLDISQQSKNFLVYVLSWVVILAVFLLFKVNSCLGL